MTPEAGKRRQGIGVSPAWGWFSHLWIVRAAKTVWVNHGIFQPYR